MTTIIKVGGGPARELTSMRSLAGELGQLSGTTGENRFALVHGGGVDVTALSRRLGVEPRFHEGVRITSDEEMSIVDMVLCGMVNKRIVRALGAEGVTAVGVSGADANLLVGERLAGPGGLSRTARVTAVNRDILDKLWESGLVPVVASPGSDESCEAVNINADEATLAIGEAVEADAIVFLSDVRGVVGPEGTLLSTISTAEVEPLIRGGTVRDGMVAKLRSAAGAIAAGVNHIVIGSYDTPGDLERLVAGRGGTTIHGDAQ
jgi:acetylglutamate kinase